MTQETDAAPCPCCADEEPLEFDDPAAAAGFRFDQPPAQAVEYFRNKGLQPTFHYLDMEAQEHENAFTVAKMMDVDLLATVRDALDRALAEGRTMREFKAEVIPDLQKKGWWGRQPVEDPLTGETIEAELGSHRRLELIFRQNMQDSLQAGAWEKIEEQAEDAPYLQYSAILDHRVRPEHEQWDGTVRPVHDSFWDTHYPPNGFNCRCSAIQLDDDDLEDFGLEVSDPPEIEQVEWTNPRTGKTKTVPKDIDPQWDHNPGKARMQQKKEALKEKLAALPEDMQPDDAQAARLVGAPEAVEELQADAARKKAKEAAREAEKAGAEAKLQRIAEGTVKDPGNWQKKAYKQLSQSKLWQEAGPVEKLAKLEKRAKQLKDKHTHQTQLSAYKNKKIKGQEPSPAQKKAFEKADPETQQKLLDQIQAAKKEEEAKAKLDALQTSPHAHPLEKAALKQLKESGQAGGLKAHELLEKVQAKAEELQHKAKLKQQANAYKKAVVAGKQPKQEHVDAFQALPPEEQEKIAEEIQQAQQQAHQDQGKEAPPADKPVHQSPEHHPDEAVSPAITPDKPLNPDALTKTAPKTEGNQPGYFARDTETGAEWLIKQPADPDHARSEALAAKLYEAAGIDVPHVRTVEIGGRTHIASELRHGARKPKGAGELKTPEVRRGMAVDAWLGNWDSVGLGYDNIMIEGGKPVRIDPGGSLEWRAGGQKKPHFGTDVEEWHTLRNPHINKQAAEIFGDATPEELREGAKAVAGIQDETIDELVRHYGPGDEKHRQWLADTLKARRDDIVQKAGLKARAGDRGKVDEQTKRRAADQERSKVLGTKRSADDAITAALKGVNMQASAGDTIRAKDIQRAQEALDEIAALRLHDSRQYMTPEAQQAIDEHYGRWQDALQRIRAKGEGAPAEATDVFEPLSDESVQTDPDAIPEELIEALPSYDEDQVRRYLADRAALVPTGKAAQKVQKAVQQGMSELEAIAVVQYTGSLYGRINDELRQFRHEVDPTIWHARQCITEALRKAPKRTGKLYRGVDLDRTPKGFLDAHTKPGTVIRWNAPSSTSYVEGGAFGGDVEFEVETESGHGQIDAWSLIEREREVLMSPGAVVEVVDAKKRDGKWKVTVRERGTPEEYMPRGEDPDIQHEFAEPEVGTLLDRMTSEAACFEVLRAPE